MKRYLLSALILVIGSSAFAQIKPVRVDTIKTPNALCEPCKVKIEDYVKQYDGVLEVNVMIRKGITRVKYLTDRTNIEILKTAIANCGFDASEIPASPDFYKLLPACCKKPEDGGIKPKTPPKPAQ
jgi:copper chaperone CopZ